MPAHGRRRGLKKEDAALAAHSRLAPPNTPLRIGSIGLGVGVLAALEKSGDLIRVYALNPVATALAKRCFSFIHDAGPTPRLVVCLFTNTPDESFIVDFHPERPEALPLSLCSGHGYKFRPVVGELLIRRRNGTKHAVGFLRLARFRQGGCARPLTPAASPSHAGRRAGCAPA